MNKDEILSLYERAAIKWGNIAQIRKAIEECGELIVALAKGGRDSNSSNFDDILEEIADVEIMLEQMKLMFNYDFQLTKPKSKFHAFKELKLKRLEKRLNELS